jgi:hypothetical protein
MTSAGPGRPPGGAARNGGAKPDPPDGAIVSAGRWARLRPAGWSIGRVEPQSTATAGPPPRRTRLEAHSRRACCGRAVSGGGPRPSFGGLPTAPGRLMGPKGPPRLRGVEAVGHLSHEGRPSPKSSAMRLLPTQGPCEANSEEPSAKVELARCLMTRCESRPPEDGEARRATATEETSRRRTWTSERPGFRREPRSARGGRQPLARNRGGRVRCEQP